MRIPRKPTPSRRAAEPFALRPSQIFRLSRRALLGMVAGGLVARPLAAAVSPEQVYESAYNYIIVARDGRIVLFRRMENGATLSAIDLDNPARQVIPYTRFLFAPALVDPRPAKVLSIGLGAGAFNRLFNLGFPDAKLVTVEIDPMIVKVAREFTGFKDGDSNQVITADGRRYLKQTTDTWDWIVVDAFVRNSQVPPHLTTLEFFRLIDSRMNADGVLAVNLLGGGSLFSSLVATIRKVFPETVLLPVPERTNIIALATKGRKPLAAAIQAATTDTMMDLRGYDVDYRQIKKSVTSSSSFSGGLVLTDDYSPTEFMSGGRSRGF